MKSKKEEVIEILKYEAQLQDTEDYTDHEIVNIDEIAERIVKLFAIPVVIESVCHSCKSDIAEEFIPKCYCPECGVEWQTGL